MRLVAAIALGVFAVGALMTWATDWTIRGAGGRHDRRCPDDLRWGGIARANPPVGKPKRDGTDRRDRERSRRTGRSTVGRLAAKVAL